MFCGEPLRNWRTTDSRRWSRSNSPSIQTTVRYLGVQQDLQGAPCDHLGLHVKSGPAKASRGPHTAGIRIFSSAKMALT